jgi:hypothetical protein
MGDRKMINRPVPKLGSYAPRSNNSIYKAAAAHLRAYVEETSLDLAARKLFGKDYDDVGSLVTRATSTPATLTTPSWAGTAAHDVVASELIQRITALSAGAALMARGMKVNLTGVASITIPGRVYNPSSPPGGWISEGAPIPVEKSSVVGGPRLEPRKLAVISTFTREMVESDNIVEFTEAALRERVAALLDLQMFSTTAGDATRPGGILIGANVVTPTVSTTSWAISSDVGALIGAIATAGGGLEPVIIASPAQATALKMWGQEDFYDVLSSVALPAGTVVAVESSSFVSGFDGIPEISTSKAALVHMEDTTPQDIVSGGVAASPEKSYFQTDLVDLRVILRAAWGMRNQKHVAIVQGVSW